MKLYNRILSTILAVILTLGSFAIFGVVGVSAEEASSGAIATDEKIHGLYVNTVHKTPQAKLDTMTKSLSRGDYELYVDAVSGEVAMKNKVTGDILFSNPYDIASSKGSNDLATGTKNEILSQLVIQYIDNGTTKYLYSFTDAAMREQIKVLNIKNGVRVEYTIGREESRKLVPRQISETNFNKFIKDPLTVAVEKEEFIEFYYKKFTTYFSYQSLAEKSSNKAKEMLLNNYPICAEMNIYTLVTDISATELNWVESYIKTYCQDYTFEQMDADHEETGYVAKDEKFPLFKMALEYYLDDSGLNVVLPCNGLRYDMAAYTLENFSILPFMGAGNSKNPGYNFYPDGSGSLFDFEQLNTKSTTTVKGKVYGVDYAYHQITGTYQKSIRYPVYGTVATETIYSFSYTTSYKLDENQNLVTQKNAMTGKSEPIDTGELKEYTLEVSNTVMTLEDIEKYVADRLGTMSADGVQEKTYKRGFVATINSGESRAEIMTYHAGALSDYNTMKNFFNPKPKDSYDIADSISVTSSSTWTVVSDRKYTGNIEIHYQMLTDPEKEITVEDAEGVESTKKVSETDYLYYGTTWLGMAEAFRDKLIANGTLKPLDSSKTDDGIPLYLEVFGTLETQETIMTVPVDVMTPLTTFENVGQMYDALYDKGVQNINFKMTGFANGGMYATVPAALKWEKVVGGKKGLAALVEKAEAVNAVAGQNMGLYPDFDFAYIHSNTTFDSTNLKKDAVKTIDNRYSSQRQYSATKQTYISFFQLAISPSRYSKFYTKLLSNYEQYGLKGMSVSSLGTALNSDFDEDDPYNREDGKDFTVQAFTDLKEAGYSLMTEGANAYSWGYVDHIINVDLDSSRYIKSSASVPFIGVVLHGFVQFAGTPLNEEGDTDYAILRAIENGAGLYFILSYQNTQELKEDEFLSQYYSVRYDIWENDVIAYYKQLNELLKDVQNKLIIDHQFLEGKRVLDLDELEDELEEQMKDAAIAEQEKQEAIRVENTLKVANAWKTAETAVKTMNGFIAEISTLKNSIETLYTKFETQKDALAPALEKVLLSMKTVADEKAENGTPDEEEEEGERVPTAAETSLATNISLLNTQIGAVRTTAVAILKNTAQMKQVYDNAQQLLADVLEAEKIIRNPDDNTIKDPAIKNQMADMVLTYHAEAKSLFDASVPANYEAVMKYAEGGAEDIAVAAVAAISVIKAEGEYEIFATDLQVACAETLESFTTEKIYEAGRIEDSQTDSDTEDEEGQKVDRYHVANNQIVLVTYGDRDATTHAKTAYKSFILNYNNFAVTVNHGGITYTIPSGGYVVLYANA